VIPRRLIAGLGIALLAGCSSAMQQGGSTNPRGDPSVIGAAELKDASYSNLYDLIQALRPRWLAGRVRSGGWLAQPEVLLDSRQLGGTDALREILPTSVVEVRYYDPSAAQAVFGPEHTNGVIRVRSRPSH
jgi:hypothetical protein